MLLLSLVVAKHSIVHLDEAGYLIMPVHCFYGIIL